MNMAQVAGSGTAVALATTCWPVCATTTAMPSKRACSTLLPLPHVPLEIRQYSYDRFDDRKKMPLPGASKSKTSSPSVLEMNIFERLLYIEFVGVRVKLAAAKESVMA